jgi:hypothetical protein
MKKLKAFFGSFINPQDSAAYAGWGALGMKALCLINASACNIIGALGGDTLITSLLTYAAMRAMSKGVKAK